MPIKTRARLRALMLCLLLAFSGACSSTLSNNPPPQAGAGPDDKLWFTKSQVSTERKYLAHYFTPHPRSYDNAEPDSYTTQYLSVRGESGQHAHYGGYWRDRPLERPPLSGDFQLEDAKWEIQAAEKMGIDGFLVDLLSLDNYSYRLAQKLVDASVALGGSFLIIPMIDTTGPAAAIASPQQWAQGISYFVGKPSSYYLPDGRFLVSSFFAENKSAPWWEERLEAIASVSGVEVAFHAGLLDLNRIADYSEVATYVGPWSYGADPAQIGAAAPRASAIARAAGLKWMGSVLTQNVRPSQSTFDEAANSEALRASWQRIFRENADLVQAVTWNDFSEGGQLTPSVARSWGPASLSAYYAEHWKTGSFPSIQRDELLLSHRDQPLSGAAYQSRQTSLMTQKIEGGVFTPTRNLVEALTFLTAPASVSVSVGSETYTYTAPAGEFVATFGLDLGTVSASMSRDGVVVATVTSPFTVSANPVSQDRQYFFVSSLHGTTGQHPLMAP